MAKVDGSLGSLVQGVSQQPDRARNVGQSEEQINVTNDEVFGMSRRPATYAVDYIDAFPNDASGNNVVEHGIFTSNKNRLAYSTRLATVGTDPELKLSLDGTDYTVTLDEDAKNYLHVASTEKEYEKKILIRELDGTLYVVNTDKVVAKLPDVPDEPAKPTTVVYARGGQYATQFDLVFVIDGTKHVISFVTPNGSAAAHSEQVLARYIMRQLYYIIYTAKVGSTTGANPENTKVNAALLSTGWAESDFGYYMSSAGADTAISNAFDTKMLSEHIVFIPKAGVTNYSITAKDGSGTDLIKAIRDTVEDAGDLPNRASVDMIVKVLGDNKASDDYYLQWKIDGYTTDALVDEKGIWQETTAPAEAYKLDPETMPHELYKHSATEYRIRAIDWTDREAGNSLSNPFPAFVGETIQDIADFQGRMVFLHGKDVSMSTTDDYTNWFKKTAAAELDTDPINVRSTATDGDSLPIYAVPFNRDLVIFGTNNAQFMISGRSTLTYETASMVLTSEFNTDLRTRPKQAGENILFLSWTGKYAQMSEMYLRGNENNHARRRVTDHVPRYMEGQGTVFAADDASNTAIVVTDVDPKTAYVYEYLWLDDRLVKSAWSKWSFDAEVVALSIDRGVLTSTFKTDSGAFLTTTSTLYRQDETGLDFQLHLDHIQPKTLADDVTFDIEYFGDTITVDDLVVVALTGDAVHGMPLKVTSVVANAATSAVNTATVTLKNSYTGDILAGRRFLTRFVPTPPTIRDGDGVAVSGAELTVTRYVVTFEDTGPFNMIRESSYEAPEDYWVMEYSGRILGDPDFTLGSVPMDSGFIDFTFDDLTTTSKLVIECDTHLPMTLTEIEWEGNVKNRSRRVTNGG